MGARMVDITGKGEVYREATATGFIKLRPETVKLIREGRVEKGDIRSIASIAAILAVKKTPEIVPLTHNIPITGVDVRIEVEDEGVRVYVTVKTTARTGVEMEALTGVAAALLAIWDMVKKYEKDEAGQYPFTYITDIRVLEKKKGE